MTRTFPPRGRLLLTIIVALLAGSKFSWGATFPLPAADTTVIGHVRVVIARQQDTLLDIARHYDVGYNEIRAANPGVSVWLPRAGTQVVVPTEFILPPKPWVGIVVNVPERRLFYFPKPRPGHTPVVVTFPVGIARHAWPTPLGRTRIVAKYRNPSWIVPEDIRQEHIQEGELHYPRYFPPGPNNPMGMLALQTGFPEIFIHGTDKPWGVGMRPSHGCFQLYPEDASYLFPRVGVGTPVRIIDQPYVVGRRNGKLYMASFKPVGDYHHNKGLLTRAVAAVLPFLPKHLTPALEHRIVDWGKVMAVAQAQRMIPTPIVPGTPGIAEIIAAIRPRPYTYPPYGADANDAAPPPLLAK